MWEIQVRGCQLAASNEVNAQAIPSGAEALEHVRVAGDVLRVVVIEKAGVPERGKGGERQADEQENEAGMPPAASCRGRRGSAVTGAYSAGCRIPVPSAAEPQDHAGAEQSQGGAQGNHPPERPTRRGHTPGGSGGFPPPAEWPGGCNRPGVSDSLFGPTPATPLPASPGTRDR